MQLLRWQRGTALVFACSLIFAGTPVLADCSDGDVVAVFLVGGLYPEMMPQIEILSAAPVGPVTNPSVDEMNMALCEVQSPPGIGYAHAGVAGPFHLFYMMNTDMGACGIVDGRDGAVLFAGTIIWMGTGIVAFPAASSHDWTFPGGSPAPEPEGVAFLPSSCWEYGYGTPSEITAMALAHLRSTDVLASFGICGPYSVTSYIYTPAVGMLQPELASVVVIVNGRCGPPWNQAPVGVETSTWTRLKALFR